MTVIGKAVDWAIRGSEQACESCGATFTCGPLTKGGCWCMQEKVPPEKLEELKSKYKRCLCSDCLRKVAEVE
jgi:hypothetical protein